MALCCSGLVTLKSHSFSLTHVNFVAHLLALGRLSQRLFLITSEQIIATMWIIFNYILHHSSSSSLSGSQSVYLCASKLSVKEKENDKNKVVSRSVAFIYIKAAAKSKAAAQLRWASCECRSLICRSLQIPKRKYSAKQMCLSASLQASKVALKLL